MTGFATTPRYGRIPHLSRYTEDGDCADEILVRVSHLIDANPRNMALGASSMICKISDTKKEAVETFAVVPLRRIRLLVLITERWGSSREGSTMASSKTLMVLAMSLLMALS